MKQTHVAGGPLGVGRADRALEPRAREESGTIKPFLAVISGAGIVEAIAVSSFGLVAGTAIAVLAATAMGIAYLTLGRR